MKRKELRLILTGLMMLITTILLTPRCPAWAKAPQAPAGSYHTVGLKSDGTVVAAGGSGSADFGQTNVSSWTDIVAVSAGESHTVGLKSDGTVVAVGSNGDGQLNVSSWGTDISVTAVAAGGHHTVGLKSDGTVVAVGGSIYIDGVSSWGTDISITAVAAGSYHTVGLKSNGTVVAAGTNSYGQLNITDTAWTNIVAVAAGQYHTVGLKSDGTVVAAGGSGGADVGQTNVSSWTNITAISAGGLHTVGLKSDGTVVATGSNSYHQTDVSSWTDIVAISAGGLHTVGLKSDGTVVATGSNSYHQTDVSSWHLQIMDTDIKGGRGTQVILKGAGFGSKKGTVSVGTTPAKVISWYDTRIIFQTTASLAPGEYPIYVTPKGGSSVAYGKPFIMKAPELQFVQASEGYAGDLVILAGKYFGSKKGTVVLGMKSCAVSYWYMEPTSGESMAAFKVPSKMTPGHYNVTLTNEAGSATFPMVVFTAKSGKSTSMAHEESWNGSFSDE